VSPRAKAAGAGGCAFCEVAAGRVPAALVEEGDGCIALMDLHPVRPGHVLVLPRAHASRLDGCTEEVRDELWRMARRVAAAQQAAGLAGAATYLLLDGPGTGQHLPHVHLHVVPRFPGDLVPVLTRFMGRMLLSAFGRREPAERLEAVAARIRVHLPGATGSGWSDGVME
jgi:histidine triad (HIT) family protein